MKRLTVILINSNLDIQNNNKEIEIIQSNEKNVRRNILIAKGKYISFICNEDYVSEDYLNVIYNKTFEDFDCCYINSQLNYKQPRKIYRNDEEYLSSLKPYYVEYIWNWIYRANILRKIIDFEANYEFDEKIDKIIKKSTSISEIIYFHNPIKEKETITNIPYVDYKRKIFYKNIIYIKDSLEAVFNGVISWVLNIGKCFGEEYKITVLYDDIYDETKKKLSKYFKLVHREKYTNYFCDRFIGTYLDYDIPINVFYNEESSTFIHGLMDEGLYLEPDMFDRYIAVSKTCRDTVKFNFQTDYKPEYIHNPVKIESKKIKPHLKLVSTLRSEKIKGMERLKQIARILDEEEIPYTWNVFTDENEGINESGFIMRHGVFDPLSYVKDADYLVMLSDEESFCYSVIEALSLQTKVVVTPVEVFKEIGAKDKENAYFIPFEFFKKKNKNKLKEKVLEIYKNKDRSIQFESNLNFNEFKKLLKK